MHLSATGIRNLTLRLRKDCIGCWNITAYRCGYGKMERRGLEKCSVMRMNCLFPVILIPIFIPPWTDLIF